MTNVEEVLLSELQDRLDELAHQPDVLDVPAIHPIDGVRCLISYTVTV